jgi:hypothetical protein
MTVYQGTTVFVGGSTLSVASGKAVLKLAATPKMLDGAATLSATPRLRMVSRASLMGSGSLLASLPSGLYFDWSHQKAWSLGAWHPQAWSSGAFTPGTWEAA